MDASPPARLRTLRGFEAAPEGEGSKHPNLELRKERATESVGATLLEFYLGFGGKKSKTDLEAVNVQIR